jgi:mono/diheme cytochrome c family protein
MRRAWLIIALVASGAAAAERPSDPSVERGRDIAARQCAECHALRHGRDSPDGDAPTFPVLRLRYNELSLERRLAGIPWGDHAGMPPIGLTRQDRQDLAAFIESLPPRHR